jgi:hypothetical protein
VVVYELGERFEFFFGKFAVVILIELVEHLFRLGHARRAAGTRLAFWAASAGFSAHRLHSLTRFIEVGTHALAGASAKVSHFFAGFGALVIVEFAITIFVELFDDSFAQDGVVALAFFLIAFLCEGAGRQQADGQKCKTGEEIPHVVLTPDTVGSLRHVIAAQSCHQLPDFCTNEAPKTTATG